MDDFTWKAKRGYLGYVELPLNLQAEHVVFPWLNDNSHENQQVPQFEAL